MKTILLLNVPASTNWRTVMSINTINTVLGKRRKIKKLYYCN